MLESDNQSLCSQKIVFLYNLSERLLANLVATKKLWNIIHQLVDELDTKKEKGEIKRADEYYFDRGKICYKVEKTQFVNSISEAHALGLISKRLKDRLDKFSEERNNLIHDVYSFNKQNNQNLTSGLIEAETIVLELISIIESVVSEDIRVNIDKILASIQYLV